MQHLPCAFLPLRKKNPKISKSQKSQKLMAAAVGTLFFKFGIKIIFWGYLVSIALLIKKYPKYYSEIIFLSKIKKKNKVPAAAAVSF